MHRCLAVALLSCLPAQNTPLTPTSNLVLDTTATQGHFAFSFIDIPVGVRVSFTGTHPVQIQCAGNAVIRGQLDVDASGSAGGPGSVTTGTGTAGNLYWSSYCTSPSTQPGPGAHAGLYGSSLPFSLAGGSPGGSLQWWGQPHPGPFCLPSGSPVPGGGGGGSLVLDAGGSIEVFGRVSANGDNWLSVGSGGSLLLRGLAGVTVHAMGLIQATSAPNAANVYPPGIIRLDAYGHIPIIAGTVDPLPFALALPYLEETQPPVIGNVWRLRVAAPRGNGVTLAVSFQPGSTTNQFGTVGIHLPTAIPFTFLALPNSGHDPLATYQLAIANDPGLVGINLYVAGLDWFTALPPRYTNSIQSAVQ